MGGISTGIPPDFNRYNELAVGFLQLAVDGFAGSNGVPLSLMRFDTGPALKFSLYEERLELIQNIRWKIENRIVSILPRVALEHRFAYRLLPSLNILIGLDPREFEDESDCVTTAWEDTGDF